ncbi:MAG: potassium channel family protein [Candidatus Odinarchaeia archaeon]
MDKIEYEPVSIRESIREMKDIAWLMIDLAYSAVLFKDKEIAEEVLELEEKMDILTYLVQMSAMLAARDAEDAERLTALLKVATATDKISDAAADIAITVLKGIEVHPLILDAIREAEEPITRVKVVETSILCNKTLGELKLRTETGIDVIAIKRGKNWIYDPSRNTAIEPNDILFARGSRTGIETLNKLALGKISEL